MAANFNIVPATLLELDDRNGVIKAQVATALPLLAINTLLSDDEELKYQKYQAILRFWVSPEGLVERFEISQFSGDPELKKRVETAMAAIKQFGKPPADLAQPINWQVTSSL